MVYIVQQNYCRCDEFVKEFFGCEAVPLRRERGAAALASFRSRMIPVGNRTEGAVREGVCGKLLPWVTGCPKAIESSCGALFAGNLVGAWFL